MREFLKVFVFVVFFTFSSFYILNANEDSKSPTVEYTEIYDPIEPVNRAVLKFNFFIDDYAIRPVVKTYKFIAPDFVEKGVSNFFSNLKEPINSIAFFFQGEFNKSFKSIGRFSINTLTSIGTFDLADKIGIEKEKTDLGITLAKGGVESGPYIVIPIIGPSNLRDVGGTVVEYFVDPIGNNIPNREYISIGSGLNARVEVDDNIDQVKKSSSDRYEMIKSIYYQNRQSQIEDEFVGDLPVPKIYIE
jgi:phospholipid-binding lipoprotein MlaA